MGNVYMEVLYVHQLMHRVCAQCIQSDGHTYGNKRIWLCTFVYININIVILILKLSPTAGTCSTVIPFFSVYET